MIILIILLNSCIKNINDTNIIYKGFGMEKKENKELIEASKEGNVEGVIAALNKGANINQKDNLDTEGDNRTALIYASEYGYIDLVKLLLERGARVNNNKRDSDTALMCASWRGYIEIVKLLLDKGADVNQKSIIEATALMKASSEGHLDVVKLLLDNGANVNDKTSDGQTALIEASSRGHTEILKLLLDNGADVNFKTNKGETALMKASNSFSGNIETVKLLLERGADSSYIATDKHMESYTALTLASLRGHINIVRLFEKEFNSLDLKGLISAVYENNINKIKFLLENELDSLDERYINTAFILSLFYKNKEASKLLEEKTSINYTWELRRTLDTPLIKAATRGDAETLKLLILYGANITHKNRRNKTALNLVSKKMIENKEKENEYVNMAHMLIQAIKTNYIILLKNLDNSFIDIITKEKAKSIIENDIIFINSLQKLPSGIFTQIIKNLE